MGRYDDLVQAGKSAPEAMSFIKTMQGLGNDPQKLDVFNKALSQRLEVDPASKGDALEAALDAANFVDMKRQVDANNAKFKLLDATDPERARLQKTSQLLTAALLDKDVYFNGVLEGILPEGVRRTEQFDYNTPNEDVTQSGFFAALYENTTGNGGTTHVLASRGTESGDYGGRDWATNIGQQGGFATAQFKQAVDLAVALKGQYGSDLSFTGHSLGGGLASAQALKTQLSAITFNAEGLSDNTISRLGLDTRSAKSLITAAYTNGELLSRLQDNKTLGTVLSLVATPTANGIALGSTAADHLGGHKPDWHSFGLTAMGPAQGTRLEMPAINAAGHSMSWGERFTGTVGLHFMTSVAQSLMHTVGSNNGVLPDSYLRNLRIAGSGK